MNTEIFHRFADIIPKAISPGFISRIMHTATNTINFLEIKAGSISEVHQHPHHQCAFVLEGAFELTVNGESQLLTPGVFASIAGNIPHGGRAITGCKLSDIFNPVREDSQ